MWALPGSIDNSGMRVEQIMTRDVVHVAPDTSLKEVATLLVDNRISGVPVCDAEGVVLGVVSEADILRKEEGIGTDFPRPVAWLLRRLDGDLRKIEARTAADAMTRPALTVRPSQQAAEAARLMVERNVNRVPVVAGGKLAGIVSRADLVRAFTRPDEELEREIRDDVLFRTMLLVPEDFRVTVRDGHVSIGGHVATEADAAIVVRWIRQIPGVVHVEADLDWSPAEPRPRHRVASGWS
jgi:CBS domain-containing protein